MSEDQGGTDRNNRMEGSGLNRPGGHGGVNRLVGMDGQNLTCPRTNMLDVLNMAGENRPTANNSGGTGQMDGTNMAGHSGNGPNMAGHRGSGPNMADPNMTGSNMADPNMTGSNMAGLNMAGPSMSGTNMAGPNMSGTHMIGGSLAGTTVTGTSMASTNMAGPSASGASTTGESIAGTSIARASMMGMDMTGPTMVNVNRMSMEPGTNRMAMEPGRVEVTGRVSVLDYFHVPTNVPQNNFKAQCKICSTLICGSKKVTSNFVTHLKRKHVETYEELAKKKLMMGNIDDPTGLGRCRGRPLAPVVKNTAKFSRPDLQYSEVKVPLSHQHQASYFPYGFPGANPLPAELMQRQESGQTDMTDATEALLDMVIDNPLHAVSLINTATFRHLVGALNPYYHVPSVEQLILTGNSVQKFQSIKEALSQHLQYTKSLCLSVTTFERVAIDTQPHESLMCISGHYIDSHWSRRCLILSCFRILPKDEVDKVHKYEQVVDDFGLSEKVIYTIADNKHKDLPLPLTYSLPGFAVEGQKSSVGSGKCNCRTVTSSNEEEQSPPTEGCTSTIQPTNEEGCDKQSSSNQETDTLEQPEDTGFPSGQYGSFCFEAALNKVITDGIRNLGSMTKTALSKAASLIEWKASKTTNNMDDNAEEHLVSESLIIDEHNSWVSTDHRSMGDPLGKPNCAKITNWREQLDAIRELVSSSNLPSDVTDSQAQSGSKLNPSSTSTSKLSRLDLELLNKLSDMLAPFEEAVDILQNFQNRKSYASQLVGASFIIPCVRGLSAHLKSATVASRGSSSCTSISEMRTVAMELTQSMEKHLLPYEKQGVLAMAAILDPRFKMKWCHNTAESNFFKEQITSEALAIAKTMYPSDRDDRRGYGTAVDSSHSNTNVATQKRQSKLFSFMSQDSPAKCKSNAILAAEKEIGEYLNQVYTPSTEDEADPLVYWRHSAHTFPILGLLAKSYLCPPASAVAVNGIIKGLWNVDQAHELSEEMYRQTQAESTGNSVTTEHMLEQLLTAKCNAVSVSHVRSECDVGVESYPGE